MVRRSINEIRISGLLPLVFKGMETAERIADSNIWLVPEFKFEKGCRICIQAESGSGKTSLLSFLFGARRDYMGSISFDGCDIRTMHIDEWSWLRQHNFAMLPQELKLFPELTVMQNLHLKNNLTSHKSESELTEKLELLGIGNKANVKVGLLSIGQQQRVALIRAICQPFDFIMLDEPVSHLDINNNKIVASMIEEEASAQGAGIISTSVGNPLLLQNANFVTL